MLKGHRKHTLQPLQARTCQTKPISWAQMDARDCTAPVAGGGEKALINKGERSWDPKGFQSCNSILPRFSAVCRQAVHSRQPCLHGDAGSWHRSCRNSLSWRSRSLFLY